MQQDIADAARMKGKSGSYQKDVMYDESVAQIDINLTTNEVRLHIYAGTTPREEIYKITSVSAHDVDFGYGSFVLSQGQWLKLHPGDYFSFVEIKNGVLRFG